MQDGQRSDEHKSSQAGASRQPALRAVLWGTYDIGKPRVRILRDGLRLAGVEVFEIHADIWRGVEDKSRIGKAARVMFALRWALSYPSLLARYLLAPRHDVVVVPYLGHLDVHVLRPFARIRSVPVVWDMFLSLYDTVVVDRELLRDNGFAGRSLRWMERRGCLLADRVLIDTPAHARRIEGLLGIEPGTIRPLPVGAEPDAFPELPSPPEPDGPPIVLFYGQFIPLHGIVTIVEAALSPRGHGYRWHIVGQGQDAGVLEAALAGRSAAHVTWERWVDYDALRSRIAEAHVCLGIFGASDKAASVVPNKVYQALLSGRSVVTRESPAMHELFPDPDPGLRLVPHSDPDALLDALDALGSIGFPPPDRRRLAAFTPRAIGVALREILVELRDGRRPDD